MPRVSLFSQAVMGQICLDHLIWFSPCVIRTACVSRLLTALLLGSYYLPRQSCRKWELRILTPPLTPIPITELNYMRFSQRITLIMSVTFSYFVASSQTRIIFFASILIIIIIINIIIISITSAAASGNASLLMMVTSIRFNKKIID